MICWSRHLLSFIVVSQLCLFHANNRLILHWQFIGHCPLAADTRYAKNVIVIENSRSVCSKREPLIIDNDHVLWEHVKLIVACGNFYWNQSFQVLCKLRHLSLSVWRFKKSVSPTCVSPIDWLIDWLNQYHRIERWSSIQIKCFFPSLDDRIELLVKLVFRCMQPETVGPHERRRAVRTRPGDTDQDTSSNTDRTHDQHHAHRRPTSASLQQIAACRRRQRPSSDRCASHPSR